MSFLLVSGHCYDDLMSTWHQQNCTSKPDICRPSLRKKNPKAKHHGKGKNTCYMKLNFFFQLLNLCPGVIKTISALNVLMEDTYTSIWMYFGSLSPCWRV